MWQQSWASQSPGTKNTTVGQRSLSRCTIAMIWCDKAKSCWFILIFFMPRFANRIFLGQYMSNSCHTKLNTLFSGILPAKEFWVCRDCRHGIHTQKKTQPLPVPPQPWTWPTHSLWRSKIQTTTPKLSNLRFSEYLDSGWFWFMQFMDHSKVNHDLQGTNSYGSKSGHPTLYPESETCVPLMWDAKKMGSDII